MRADLRDPTLNRNFAGAGRDATPVPKPTGRDQ